MSACGCSGLVVVRSVSQCACSAALQKPKVKLFAHDWSFLRTYKAGLMMSHITRSPEALKRLKNPMPDSLNPKHPKPSTLNPEPNPKP